MNHSGVFGFIGFAITVVVFSLGLIMLISGLITNETNSVTLGAGETGTALWTPTAGKKFVVTDLIISCVEAGQLTIFDGTDSAANRLFDGFLYGAIYPLSFESRPWPSSTADNVLKATTDADGEAIVTVHGYEV